MENIYRFRSPDESWLESWNKNEKYLSHKNVIENIELLHECKEQKNEHLVQLIEQLEEGKIEPPFYARLNEDSESENEVDEDLSNLLDMCNESNNYVNKNDSDYINSTIDALRIINRFEINQSANGISIFEKEEIIRNTKNENCTGRKKFDIKSLIPATHDIYEKNIKWQLSLKMEKEKLRKAILYDSDEKNDCTNVSHASFSTNNNNEDTLLEVVVQSIDVTTQELIITKYNLNEEQRRAFIIITDHLDQKSFLRIDGNRQEQLIMCIPAPAGTGKSHLNKALTEYFNVTDRLSMLRKLAPTSVAANEMGQGGLTMQSFLHCRFQTKMSQNRKSKIEMEWKHVKYIFFDEVSMVGLDSLAKLSRLMGIAKEDWADATDPFGGKNLVFFGDLLQYDPIMDLPVYTNILKQGYELKNIKKIYEKNIEEENKAIQLAEENSVQQKQERAQAKKEKREAIQLAKVNNSLIRKKVGRALWLQINTVVILKKQMRTTDQRLLGIQNRIRDGKATKDDHNELRKRIVGIGNDLQSLNESPWNSAPIIVFRNELKTCINNKAVEKLANENRIPMIVCVANDKFSIPLQNKEIARYILSLEEKNTQSLPGYLPLVENMPVMLTRSLFTELEVSNGTIGIFKQLIYDDMESETIDIVDTKKFPKNTIYIRKPVFALIELIKTDKLPILEDLPPKIIPVPLDEQEFTIDISKMLPLALRNHRIKAPKVKVKRQQFPLVPAYAYTTHKSQGQTIPKAILDLNFPPGKFKKEVAAAYVPLTRVKVMEDLAFCRDFPLSSLQIQPSKEQKAEIERLENLNDQTKRKFESQYHYSNSKC
jgi:ATP-dependent exoDNAse (exonuclease V) alpha subunit